MLNGPTMLTSDARAAGWLQTRPGERCLMRMAAAETADACSVNLRQGINASPVRRPIAGSSLLRRLVLAKDDPAKQRIRAWLSEIDDERLVSLGLTSIDIAALRGTAGAEVPKQ